MIAQGEHLQKYLNPAVLAEIAGLDLRARLMVEGFVSGLHRSPLHGFSVEFAEYRKYAQGDDLRHLDWKVFGRTDKHYIKEYEQETNLRLLIAVDASESMNYKSSDSAWSKREFAITAAAGLSYLALQQADSVALATFDTRLRRHGRASNQSNQWKQIVAELEHRPGTGATAFRAVLDELAESLRERHLIIVLSDLLGEPNEIITGIKHLRHRRHEPIVLQILDHAELTFPFDGPVRFIGMEGVGPLATDPAALRERYLAEIHRHLDTIRRGCHAQQCDYQLLDTSAPLTTALSTYLANRAARVRRHH